MLAFLGLYPASFLVNLRFGTACGCHIQGVYDPRVDDIPWCTCHPLVGYLHPGYGTNKPCLNVV